MEKLLLLKSEFAAECELSLETWLLLVIQILIVYITDAIFP